MMLELSDFDNIQRFRTHPYFQLRKNGCFNGVCWNILTKGDCDLFLYAGPYPKEMNNDLLLPLV